MSLSILLASVLLASPQSGEFSQYEFQDQAKTFNRFQVHQRLAELVPPKMAPTKDWLYRHITAAYAQLEPELEQHELRFRVYGQVRGTPDLAPLVGINLLRLWEINFDELRIDHADAYGRVVDVYLSNEGKAGGEQRFTLDHPNAEGRRNKVNVIFIYHLDSFTDMLEQAREMAHEYGHATLPAVGGFSQPDNWANGDLGERLYLRRLRKGMEAGTYRQMDTMGARVSDLKAYEARRLDPLIQRVAIGGPEAAPFAAMDSKSMDYYLGMTLWAEDLFPDSVFRRMLLLGGATPKEAAATVIAEAETYTGPLEIPATMAGKAVWIPVGRASLKGATILQKKLGWVQVKPGAAPLEMTGIKI